MVAMRGVLVQCECRRLTPRFSRGGLIVTPDADGCKRLLARVAIGMMIRHTTMPKTKVALTLDSGLLERVDELVDRRRFRNRSQAIEAALADKLERLARTRLARESAKLDPREEKRLADEGLAEDFASWPEY
jgi:Arc/MetJ-type ribon-helix-helix transcriptional regulator